MRVIDIAPVLMADVVLDYPAMAQPGAYVHASTRLRLAEAMIPPVPIILIVHTERRIATIPIYAMAM